MKMLSRDAAVDPEGPDDAELIERSRADDSSAYEVLYERHAEAARRLAHRLARDRDRAEDLVAEAFTRVLSALRRGKGPDVAFRPYLLTVVRNIAIEWANGDKRLMLVDGYDALEHPSSDDDPVVAGAERGMAAQAFSELPERWQAVLWHTEVEGESPAGIAPLLGLSPNAVAALAVRAREGLRQGYLQAHLSGSDVPDECRDHADGLARYTRGRLVRRKSAELREHLDQCARCSALYVELVQANTGLGALIGFAVLGPLGAVYGIAKGTFGAGVFGVWLGRLRPRGNTGSAVAAGAAVVVIAAGAFAGVRLASDDSHAHSASVAQGAAPGQNNGGGNTGGGNNGGGGPNSGGHNGGNGGNPGNNGGNPGGGNPGGANPGGANPGGGNPGGGNPAGAPNKPSKHKPGSGLPHPGKPGNPGGPSSTDPPNPPKAPSQSPTSPSGLPTGPSIPAGTPTSPGTPAPPPAGTPSTPPTGGLPPAPAPNPVPISPSNLPTPSPTMSTPSTPTPGTNPPAPSTSLPTTSVPTPGATSPSAPTTPAPTPATPSISDCGTDLACYPTALGF